MENIVHLEKEPWKVSKDEHKNILLHPGTLWSPTPSNQEVSAHRQIAGLLRKKSLILFSFEIDDISRSSDCERVSVPSSKNIIALLYFCLLHNSKDNGIQK